MMRHYTLSLLTHDGKILKDNEIISWCNTKLEEIGRATSELQSHSDLVCRLLLEKKKKEKK